MSRIPPTTPAAAADAAAATALGRCWRFTAVALLLSAALVDGELRPESELSSNCFNFPQRNFDVRNCIRGINGGNTPYLPMDSGVDAIDFTLHDMRGQRWNLGDTLKEKGLPVVIIWGMFTCPAFQGLGGDAPFDRCAYWDEYELVSMAAR